MRKFIIAAGILLACAAANAQTKIVVGIAYKKMIAGGCTQFTEAVGYEYQTSSSATMSDMRDAVEEKLKARYSGASVLHKTTSGKSVACIIYYKKPIDGYSCTKFSYAVGFGNNQTEAKDAAVKEMRSYYDGDNWQIDCYIQ